MLKDEQLDELWKFGEAHKGINPDDLRLALAQAKEANALRKVAEAAEKVDSWDIPIIQDYADAGDIASDLLFLSQALAQWRAKCPKAEPASDKTNQK